MTIPQRYRADHQKGKRAGWQMAVKGKKRESNTISISSSIGKIHTIKRTKEEPVCL